PASTSARRHHCRTVSGVPTPSSAAPFVIAAHSDSCSPRTSVTIRTARSRSSTGYLLDVLPDMTPSFPRNRVSGLAGAVQSGSPLGPRTTAGHHARSEDFPPAEASTPTGPPDAPYACLRAVL